MWFSLLQYLKEKVEPKVKAKVYIGAVNPTQVKLDSAGALFFMRGHEEKFKSTLHNTFNVTFFVEAWVRDDNVDLTKGYEVLSDLEIGFENVLHTLREGAGELNEEYAILSDNYQLLDMAIQQKSGDLDSVRPLVGTQYEIVATVYRLDGESEVW